MIDLSVIICAHNPRPGYLQRVLEALKSQTLSPDKWELLLIDNASKTPLAGAWDLGWHPRGRHVREETLGLTPARMRGVAEAIASVLVFVDDDNVLDNNYLDWVARIAAEFPLLGAWGGSSIAEFETPPAPAMERFLPFLALREVTKRMWSNYDPQSVPVGAGMCVRAPVAKKYRSEAENDPHRINLDRKGTNLMGGGDFDLCLTSCAMGLGTGLFPELRLRHLIPKGRLEPDYLRNICAQSVVSFFLVQYLHFGSRPKPLSVPRRAYQKVRELCRAPDSEYYKVYYHGQARAVVMVDKLASERTHPSVPSGKA